MKRGGLTKANIPWNNKDAFGRKRNRSQQWTKESRKMFCTSYIEPGIKLWYQLNYMYVNFRCSFTQSFIISDLLNKTCLSQHVIWILCYVLCMFLKRGMVKMSCFLISPLRSAQASITERGQILYYVLKPTSCVFWKRSFMVSDNTGTHPVIHRKKIIKHASLWHKRMSGKLNY